MTSNDKTRQKLMESMRKTKAPTDKKPAVSVSKDSGSASDISTKAKTKTTSKVKKKKIVKDSSQVSADPFSSRCRIWPD